MLFVRQGAKLIKACDSCRRRKIKCDSTSSPCASCLASNLECNYSRVEKTRRKPQRSTKRIDELEARVDLMQTYLEKLLVPSAVTPQKLPVTVLGQKHDTGAMSFLRPFDEGTPLPPVTETLPLIEYYFENFNRVVPLFDESSFLLKIKETSGKQHEDDPAWWAAVNVALSIAHRFRGIESISAGKENQRALDYLRNALGVVSELTLGDPDLLGVQALLGISIILQGTDRPRQASALVASTIRLCHNLGLHKQENNSGLSSIEIEQRSRTFWIAYQLDKDYSIRLSQSPIQSDDEIELPLPGERTDDGMGQILTNDGASVMNFFRLWVELSVILSQTYSMLHTAQALKQGDFKRFQAVEVLDQRLEKWTQSIPSPFRPENMTKALPKGAILHMVILYLSYFNCLSRVHLAAIDQSVWTTGWLSPNDFSWAKLSKSSREKVLQAARASIYLLGLTPQGDNACTWLLLYYRVSAIVTLLANTVRNPTHTLARSDLQVAETCISLLSSLKERATSKELENMQTSCLELYKSAKNAV